MRRSVCISAVSSAARSGGAALCCHQGEHKGDVNVSNWMQQAPAQQSDRVVTTVEEEANTWQEEEAALTL
ncbi:hypothetical protein F2P81_026079 [Scophthalmus maximus]|uniref:Uncharacterized protein n=1 Tax=Scophthalmus maximus TaxID=52904 RepID=A0A6A4RNC0_SCOMX|nr:hypothetical protein F2P81_026079 [Scophthalmus maximus]